VHCTRNNITTEAATGLHEAPAALDLLLEAPAALDLLLEAPAALDLLLEAPAALEAIGPNLRQTLASSDHGQFMNGGW
jgi:hypothetical protein